MNIQKPPLALFAKLGVFIQEGFLAPDECRRFVRKMGAAKKEGATLADPSGDRLDETVRKTKQVGLEPASMKFLADRFHEAMPRMAEHFGVDLARDQHPQCLVYEEGDFFRRHRDGHPEESNTASARARQVSAVVFLNDSETPERFEGGDLVLYGLVGDADGKYVGMPLPARAGALAAFRSNLFHEVKPVTSGRRFSVVTWYE